ncbi:putative glycoside hydrolase [Neobacillus sp. K501]
MVKYPFLAVNFLFSFLLTQCSPNMIPFNNPLTNVKNYKIYYGEVNDSEAEQLGNYDMAILEPHQVNKEHVSKIKETGTLTFGYISIMELQNWDKKFVSKVKESDYLLDNAEKIYIDKWDTYLMDIASTRYQQLLINEIEEEIIQKKFDGIFLDTVGDIDDFYHDNEEVSAHLRAGYHVLLQTITQKYPDMLLIQNWGFPTLKTISKDYVDGIMWEDFNKKQLTNSQWGQKWVKYLQKLQQKENLAVFTVVHDKNSAKYSEEQGFIPFENKNDHYH